MKRPLVAILRGVKPEETADIVGVLIESGMTAIEIPLNSPDPFRSIEIAVKKAPAGILVGAGTVLTADAVERLHDVGGRLHGIAERRSRSHCPRPGPRHGHDARRLHADGGAARRQGGSFQPEILSGERAGRRGDHRHSRGASPDLMIAAVGGVSDKNFADYIKAGILAFGLGSSLYKPGMTAAEVAVRAKATIDAYDLAIQPEK